MRRDDMDIDEILKHYLPRATRKEVDEASEIVLKRIRSMRFQPANALLKVVKKPPKAEWLNDTHLAVLMAVEQLQGQGRPATITLKVEELLNVPRASGSAIFLLLRMMERTGLVSSSPIDSGKPDAMDKRYFEITLLGKRTLATALKARGRRVTDPLKGFA